MSDIVGRIRKLIELSKNNNSPEEAAQAAARAQELMFKYSIGEADLDVTRNDEPEEVVDQTAHTEDGKIRRDVWKGVLVNTLARAFGCKSYRFTDYATKSNRLQVVGVQSAVQTVSYLFGYLVLEINRLADEAYKEHGRGQSPRTYRNSFRMGAINTIGARLAEQIQAQQVVVRAKQAEAPASTALALYKSAQERTEEEYSVIRKRLGLRAGKRTRYTQHLNAYQRGRAAGEGLSLGGGKGLGTAKTQLEA